MTGWLRVFLWLSAAALALSGGEQILASRFVADGTSWGFAPGWQREIGFWNVGMMLVVIGALRAGDAQAARRITWALLPMYMLFGTNHLVAICGHPNAWLHYTPMIANYAGVAVGAIALSRSPSAVATPRE